MEKTLHINRSKKLTRSLLAVLLSLLFAVLCVTPAFAFPMLGIPWRQKEGTGGPQSGHTGLSHGRRPGYAE